ncbi:MAG: VWA domain-containing protein [Chloroflexota bacterium]|nr:VWA domain-containing protein [Dehalococcoidia bacterium]MDW8046024.1 VWA domain-containing protein [Chloroflexota bacterium]
MVRKMVRGREDGQALVLFAAGLIGFLVIVGLSIDVGRFLWARTQIQAAVDAAALAAAQSMPDQQDAAQKAEWYWMDNSGFIRSQGRNVQFRVTYPPGNKAVRVEASAEIPTWFVRLVGFNQWNVSAAGEAESQVLDIAMVLDISGSMCFDTYPQVEAQTAWMSPGRADRIPRLRQAIPAGGADVITIYLDSVAIFNSTSASANNQNFGYNATTPYYQRNIGGRAGTIMIDRELFTIQSINAANNSMQVRRAQQNRNTGQWTTKDAHAVGAQVWANRLSCTLAAPNGAGGPFEPYDTMVDAADYFVGLFDPQYDKIGVANFSNRGSLVASLSSNFNAVRSALHSMSPPNGATNIAHAIAVGRQILDGTGKRANAVRVLVLLTDGVANTYCGSATYNPNAYNTTSCSEGSGQSIAVEHAFNEAQRAKNADIIIYTIGLGNEVDHNFLDQIARMTGGKYFYSPTAEQLDEAFQAVAEQTHIALVR